MYIDKPSFYITLFAIPFHSTSNLAYFMHATYIYLGVGSTVHTVVFKCGDR